MSKSKEELNKLKEEVEAVNEKLNELTPEEIAQVSGGCDPDPLGSWSLTEAYLTPGRASQLVN